MAKYQTAVVVFSQNLRLKDNPALAYACRHAEQVIPVYIYTEETANAVVGAAKKWWLHHSLLVLQDSLRAKGSRLIVRQGSVENQLSTLLQEKSYDLVCMSHRYDPVGRSEGVQAADFCREHGIDFEQLHSEVLFDPTTIGGQQGQPYKVFTPFWKVCTASPVTIDIVQEPRDLKPLKKWPQSDRVNELCLLPKYTWDAGWEKIWRPGEVGANKRLEWFIKNSIDHYVEGRDFPGDESVSRLSPHLSFGEISPRMIWRKVTNSKVAKSNSKDAWGYLRQLGWREFAYHLLWHFPETIDQPLQPKFEKFPWKKNDKQLKLWQKGMTGYPIVDAGMRQLWQTGWMHNRLRMIVGSFLVKDLLITWEEGAKWFMDTLVDADVANNTLGWQWVGGCGADAAPYFRIFNPVTQGERFDRDGQYVRKWVPELAKLPNEFIHKPWDAPELVLDEAGVQLGSTYPKPIVDHAKAREIALAALEKTKV